jgi:hypothetical protein
VARRAISQEDEGISGEERGGGDGMILKNENSLRNLFSKVLVMPVIGVKDEE